LEGGVVLYHLFAYAVKEKVVKTRRFMPSQNKKALRARGDPFEKPSPGGANESTCSDRMMLEGVRLKNHCGPQPPGSPERAGFARDGVEAPPRLRSITLGRETRIHPNPESARSEH
jgi:hypothetical protein